MKPRQRRALARSRDAQDTYMDAKNRRACKRCGAPVGEGWNSFCSAECFFDTGARK